MPLDREIVATSKSSYRDNFKTTILYSFVQVYQIIIRVIRSKFVAMFIGTEGMGITSLLHSTTDLVYTATNLGLKTSGVKSVAEADVANDNEKISQIAVVLRKLIKLTGFAGMLICVFLSPVFSEVSFGNHDYTWSFVFVSVIILLDQLNNGELVLLQGMQKKKTLAKANVIGQTIGLFVAVPLYYYFRIKAIVWVLVLASLTSFLISRFYTSRLELHSVKLSWKEVFTYGSGMIKLGIVMSLQLIFSQVSNYIVRNYVSNIGGIDDVGLYSAGSTIINMYLGLVFTAMATDYFPRLTKTESVSEMGSAINQQAEIALFLFAPIVVLFVVFIKPVILLLYSEAFMPIEKMLYWAMSATLLKAMAWSMSYSIVAKSKASVYFWNEVIAIAYTTIFNILGYRMFGLTGFGISIVLSYTLYLIQVLFVTHKLFGISYPVKLWKYFAILNTIVFAALACKLFLPSLWGYVLGSLVLVVIALFTYKALDKKMGLADYIRSRFLRR